MLKFYKDASTRYLSLHLTKWFGIKLEPTMDGLRNKGLYIKTWYPVSKTRLGYCDAWIPFNPFK